MRFSQIQIHQFNFLPFFEIWQIGLLSNLSTPTLSQHFPSTYILITILYYIYNNYNYLLPVYTISAGVLRFYKNANP